jgi:hypothetical protein
MSRNAVPQAPKDPSNPAEVITWYQQMMDHAGAELRRQIRTYTIVFGIANALIVGAGIKGFFDAKNKAVEKVEQTFQTYIQTQALKDTIKPLETALQTTVLKDAESRYVKASQPYAIQPYKRDDKTSLESDLVLTLDDPDHQSANDHAKISGRNDQQTWAFVSK